ncbi:hypothetical protein Thein_1510 [Thermodesulfatator indicus DSM 15286]|uniref:Homeodomain phBC6A51-type domain-containing protein n=1 Tax=Thermodesulfatator indicus (strain DSM 15286 / JCM 11887 / CIR29812) TaxID=667014 RepID=F8AAF1_THEID|nr:helix-turn-helix domain-containing protein [Thermodesulfatator indicus]AEH45371.1 hypothetical protein Thein_1510 [Thermodesulfatator indicus DSM 15286]
MKPLSPKKAKFVELLSGGLSNEQAGKKLGISRATAWRWANEPEIKARLSELHQERLKRAHGRLLSATETAIETLERLCHHKSGYVAVQAARSILDLVLKLHEHLELKERLEAIEKRLKELEGEGHVKKKA